MLRLLDTFSGIGGFSLAARWVGGFQTVQFVEREPYCQRILAKHWPDVPIHDDICTFQPRPGSFDVITAGFPCQDVSTAGKRAGIKVSTRSGLFYELMRVVRVVRPRFIVLENVAAIVSDGLDTVLGELAQAGFYAEWACIKACDLGACHRRDRWWLVAYAPELFSHGQPAGHRRQCGPGTLPEPRNSCWRPAARRLNPDWRAYLSEPVICGGDARLPGRVDRLKALGNAVVPQVAMIPLQRVKDLAAT
jgi:DNA (cytosine-5)-methyltransferase 1